MTKAELIDLACESTGLSKRQVTEAFAALMGAISTSLQAGQPVRIADFGVFEIKDRPARKARNPSTGDVIHVPARKIVRFKAGKELREAVS